MFDLFRSRDKAVRYLLGGLLGLVALSMVITLIPGIGSTPRAPEQVVAEIGKESLTVREVQTTLQGMMRNKSIPPEMVQLYVPQLVDQMINERALAYQAKRMGFEVTDAETANAIRSVLTQLFPTGEFNKDIYERFLSDQGLTVNEFENNIAKNLLVLKLRNIALEGVVVSPQEVASEYHRRNDKIKLEYVMFDPAKVKSQVTTTPQEEQEYYSKNKGRFMTNEKRSFDVLTADEAKVAASIELPEAELRKVYDSNKDKYRTPERVNERHILISTMNKPKEEQAKLEAKAADVLKQLRAGGDFAELAKKNSDDPGSAQKGGDLGWVTRGQMVKPFEEASFSLKPKEISGLVKTDYGLHIIQVMQKEEARIKPFDEVKGELAASLKKQTVFDRMQGMVEKARAALTKNPQQAEQIARENNLTFQRVVNHGPNESLPEFGTSKEVDTAVAALKVNEVSPVFQIGQDKLAVAVETAITPVRQGEFAEMEPEVKKQLITEKTQKLAQEKTVEYTAKMKAGGSDLKALAKSLGLEVKSTMPFNRDGAADGIGPASYLEEAFTKPVGATVGPVTVDNKLFFCKVDEVIPADMKEFAAKRDDMLLALKKRKSNERKELFEDGLVTQLVKEGKIKKYPEVIQRLGSSYRS
ncbi:MAG: peptidyl-prolyl cis-trans isomerase [Bryobacteraceae bacterium]